MRFNQPFRTFPLRTTLVVSVILTALIVVLICIGIVGIPAYTKAKNEIRSLWEDVARLVALNAREEVARYFESAPTTLKMIEGLVEEGQVQTDNLESILDICYQVLKENPEMTIAYYFRPDGEFYGVFKMKEGFFGSRRTLEANRTRVINYRNKESKWVQFQEEFTDYDPRKRPYWKIALSSPNGGWSQPYLFATTGTEGFSYVLASKNKGKIEGYWGVDFQIDDLILFLHSLKVGKDGVVYLIDQDDLVVAESSSHDRFALKRFIADQLQNRRKNRIFSSLDLPKGLGIEWRIVTSIHENDFLKPIRSDALRSLGFGFIFSFLFLIATAIFFGKITKRLKEIAWEMDEVGNFIFHPRSADSRLFRIREVNAMNHALSKMKAALQSFARYIPVGLVKKLLFSGCPAELGAVKKQVTVMFADIAHFTTMAESMEAQEAVDLVEEFFTFASDSVDVEKGIIDKFIGDAVMALWGAPEAIQEAELAACRAALKMQKKFKDHPKIDHRIGINSGLAMVGNFGSSSRLDYTAMGDEVNIAARLEKLNKEYGTRILMGPSTAEAVKDHFLIRPIDSVILIGRKSPLLVYELMGEKGEMGEKMHKAAAVYHSALDAYLGGQNQKAKDLFEQANDLFGGNDLPSQIMLQRLRA